MKSGHEGGLISVIIPVFNGEDTLRICVESVCRQTYSHLQIIIVDDGSTDGTPALCEELSAKDHRILCLHQPNRGVSSARNLGLERAQGQYITFLDADDLLHSCALACMHQAIVDTGKGIAVCRYVKGGENELPDLYSLTENRTRILPVKWILKDILHGSDQYAYCWGKLWKRDVVEQIQFPPLSASEDILFLYRALTAHAEEELALVEGSPLYVYVQREDSVSHTLNAKHLLDALESARQILFQSAATTTELQHAARCNALNTAFFVLLHAGSEISYLPVRVKAEAMICDHRFAVLLDPRAPIKSKAAVLLSLLNMKLLRRIYVWIKNRECIKEPNTWKRHM